MNIYKLADKIEEKLEKQQVLSKDTMHDAYLYDAFVELGGFGYFTLEDFENYFMQNKSQINKMRQMFSKRPTRLGAGMFGIAFDVGDNKVLKLFSDKISYKASLEQMKKLYEEPTFAKTEAMIYDSGELPPFKGKPIYYYVIEKMLPIVKIEDQKLQLALKKLSSSIESFFYADKDTIIKQLQELMPDPSKHSIGRKLLNEYVDKIYNDLSSKEPAITINNKLDLNPNWLKLFIEEIILKLSSNRWDLHIGNIGITKQKQLRFFDF